MRIKKFIYEHTFLSSFIFTLLCYGFLQIASLLAGVIFVATGNSIVRTEKSIFFAVLEIVLGIILAVLFCVIFRKEFRIKLLPKDFSDPRFFVHYLISLLVVTLPLDFSLCYYGFHSTWYAFLTGLAAGIAEEVMCRLIPISILMSSEKTRDKKNLIVFVSAVPFALLHCLNAVLGADLKYTLIQVIFAFGFGVLFAAMYIVSGNILFPLFLHFIYDYVSLAISSGTGLVTSADVGNITVAGFIFEVVVAVIYILLSRMFMDRWNLKDNNKMWEKIWIKPLYVKKEDPVVESCYEFSSLSHETEVGESESSVDSEMNLE